MDAKELIEFYQKQGKPIQLNLGCFDKKFPEYINIDIREDTKCDIVDNIVNLESIPDNICSLIEAHHVLEHLTYQDADKALRNWHKKLIKGGKVRISVPDFDMACRLYIWKKDIKLVRSMLSGSQRHFADQHLSHYDKEFLTELLESCFFEDIQEWHWQFTYPHNYIDSYCSSYWPHMAKEWRMANGQWLDMGGSLLSLNLEGTKS